MLHAARSICFFDIKIMILSVYCCLHRTHKQVCGLTKIT